MTYSKGTPAVEQIYKLIDGCAKVRPDGTMTVAQHMVNRIEDANELMCQTKSEVETLRSDVPSVLVRELILVRKLAALPHDDPLVAMTALTFVRAMVHGRVQVQACKTLLGIKPVVDWVLGIGLVSDGALPFVELGQRMAARLAAVNVLLDLTRNESSCGFARDAIAQRVSLHDMWRLACGSSSLLYVNALVELVGRLGNASALDALAEQAGFQTAAMRSNKSSFVDMALAFMHQASPLKNRLCLSPKELTCFGFKLQTKNIAFGRSHAEFSIEAADANIDHVFFAGDDLKSCVFYHDRSQLELTLSTEAARRIQHSANLDAGEFSREQIAIKIDRNEAMHIGTAGKQPMFLHEILNLCNRSAREVSASPIARVGGGGAFTSTMECGKPRALASAFRETPDSVIETTQTEQPLKPKLTFAQAAEPQQGVAAGAAPRASAPKTAAAAAAAAKPARAPLVGAKAALQTGATAGADSFQHFDEKLKPAFDQQPTRTAPQRGNTAALAKAAKPPGAERAQPTASEAGDLAPLPPPTAAAEAQPSLPLQPKAAPPKAAPPKAAPPKAAPPKAAPRSGKAASPAVTSEPESPTPAVDASSLKDFDFPDAPPTCSAPPNAAPSRAATTSSSRAAKPPAAPKSPATTKKPPTPKKAPAAAARAPAVARVPAASQQRAKAAPAARGGGAAAADAEPPTAAAAPPHVAAPDRAAPPLPIQQLRQQAVGVTDSFARRSAEKAPAIAWEDDGSPCVLLGRFDRARDPDCPSSELHGAGQTPPLTSDDDDDDDDDDPLGCIEFAAAADLPRGVKPKAAGLLLPIRSAAQTTPICEPQRLAAATLDTPADGARKHVRFAGAARTSALDQGGVSDETSDMFEHERAAADGALFCLQQIVQIAEHTSRRKRKRQAEMDDELARAMPKKRDEVVARFEHWVVEDAERKHQRLAVAIDIGALLQRAKAATQAIEDVRVSYNDVEDGIAQRQQQVTAESRLELQEVQQRSAAGMKNLGLKHAQAEQNIKKTQTRQVAEMRAKLHKGSAPLFDYFAASMGGL